jgi:hypothetical protein
VIDLFPYILAMNFVPKWASEIEPSRKEYLQTNQLYKEGLSTLAM